MYNRLTTCNTAPKPNFIKIHSAVLQGWNKRTDTCNDTVITYVHVRLTTAAEMPRIGVAKSLTNQSSQTRATCVSPTHARTCHTMVKCQLFGIPQVPSFSGPVSTKPFEVRGSHYKWGSVWQMKARLPAPSNQIYQNRHKPDTEQISSATCYSGLRSTSDK